MNVLTLILQAGPVAKVTMVVLLAISVGAWTVIWFKWQELRRTEFLLYELSKTIEHAEDSVSLAGKLRAFRKTAGWRVVRGIQPIGPSTNNPYCFRNCDRGSSYRFAR